MNADLIKRMTSKLFGMGVDSYNRIEVALQNFRDHGHEHRLECYAALGAAWQSCDNLSAYRDLLWPLMTRASREALDSMMDAGERQAWAALPDVVTVYRGCGAHNMAGFSWSLDRGVAERFPFLNRYRVEHPLLVTGRVSKSRIVLKLDRDEREVIAARVRRVSVEPACPIRPNA